MVNIASLNRNKLSVTLDLESVENGWIIRGKENGKPVTYVALTREQLFDILERLEL